MLARETVLSTDFGHLNRILLSQGEQLLASWLPGGKRVGTEYVCASLEGGAGRSLSVNLNTGLWADFAGGKDLNGKDLIALYAAIHGMNNGQAARELSEKYGDIRTVTRTAEPVVEGGQKIAYVVPDDQPDPSFHHRDHGNPTKVWTYRDEKNRRLMFVARYDKADGDKTFCPFIWDGKRWQKRHWHEPYPLYGLDLLALHPGMSVIIVEGEKAADAARKLCPGQVVVTWPGGSNRWHKTDLAPLYGRRIVLWPDNDKAGIQAMQGLARALQSHCPTIKIFNVSDMPEKWDAADALESGWSIKDMGDWAQKHITEIQVVTAEVSRTVKGAPETPATVSAKPNGHAAALAVSFYSLWEQWGLTKAGSVPHANVDNARLILDRDPTFKDKIWFDEFLQKYLVRDPGGFNREWEEADEIQLQCYMQRDLGIPRMSAESVRRAFITSARQHRRNCVRDWMDGLVWDGEPRIDRFLEDCFCAEPDNYVLNASKNFWLSMCARIYRPGCKVDNMLVFEGGQGIGKSLGIQIIGGDYWTEQPAARLVGNSFYEVIQGKMLIELGELASFKNATDDEVKRAISCPTDRYREPYAPKAVDHPRQCVFVGNSNRDDYLKDETGGRRFWPIRVRGNVDLDMIARYRDQLFAEAIHRLNPKGGWNPLIWHFNGGETWWEMPQEQAAVEQAKRLQEDAWTEHIVRYIENERIGDQWTPRPVPLVQVTMNEILQHALFFKEISRIQKNDEHRVGRILTALGFRKYSARVGNDPKLNQFTKVWRREFDDE